MKRLPDCGIYLITNFINGKRYVGSSDDIHARWLNHKSELRRNKHGNSYLQRAWIKYGEDAFIWQIIEYVLEPADLLKREAFWIKEYKSDERAYGYNLRSIDLVTGRQVFTAEQRLQISLRQLGKPRSQETKAKVSRAKLGVKNAENHNLNISKHYRNEPYDLTNRITGERWNGYNLARFARDKGIMPNIYYVIHGARQSAGGWQLTQATGLN